MEGTRPGDMFKELVNSESGVQPVHFFGRSLCSWSSSCTGRSCIEAIRSCRQRPKMRPMP